MTYEQIIRTLASANFEGFEQATISALKHLSSRF